MKETQIKIYLLKQITIYQKIYYTLSQAYFIDGLMILFAGCIPGVLSGIREPWIVGLALISSIYLIGRILLTFHYLYSIKHFMNQLTILYAMADAKN